MGVYAGGNPYGDIYRLPTSAIDTIAARIYQEQKVREQQKLQQDKALDDEFARNVAGVKSADIPDITKAYSAFKEAHINLQKKGQKATPQDQMDVMMKKAAAFQAINASKEDKARLAQYTAEVKSDKKGVYDPNAHTMIAEMLNTPTSQRKLDEDGNIRYKYAMPNLDKEIMYATKRDDNGNFELPVGVDPNDPLKDKVEVYKRVNPPNVFYDRLFTQLGTRSDNQNFTRAVMDNITDDELEKLRVRYETKIKDPKFIALYGEAKPFPESAGNTELGKAVAIKTMQAVDAIPLEKVSEKSVINDDRKRKADLDLWRTKQGEGFGLWLKKNGITSAQKDRRMQLTKNGSSYEIDNVPEIVNGQIVEENIPASLFTNKPAYTEKRVYLSNLAASHRSDLLGKNTPLKTTDGKEYIVVNKDGNYVTKTGVVLPSDVYINTTKRATPFEKPVGTGKMEVRGNTSATKKETPAKPKKDPLGLGF